MKKRNKIRVGISFLNKFVMFLNSQSQCLYSIFEPLLVENVNFIPFAFWGKFRYGVKPKPNHVGRLCRELVFWVFFRWDSIFLGTCHNIGNSLLTGTYYCVNMVLITMSSFLCVFVVNMSVTGTRYPVHLPKTLKKVCIENVDRSKLDNASTKHLLLWVFLVHFLYRKTARVLGACSRH